MIRYLCENKCPWNKWSTEVAAGNGNLYVLKYLHKNGCPWSITTCDAASDFGHLEVLKYARNNGCPWMKSMCLTNATDRGDDEMAEWIRAQRDQLIAFETQ